MTGWLVAFVTTLACWFLCSGQAEVEAELSGLERVACLGVHA